MALRIVRAVLPALVLVAALWGCGGPPGGRDAADALPVDLLTEIIRCEDRRTVDADLFDELLDHRDPAVRSRAVLALGRIASPGSEPLFERSMADADPEVRGTAVFAAGLAGFPSLADGLFQCLEDKDPAVSGLAVQALLRLGPGEDESAVLAGKLLAAAGETPGKPLDTLLGNAWRLEGDHGIVDLLTRWAAKSADTGGDQRLLAIYSLARRGEASAGPLLIRLLGDDDPAVRALAAKGLGAIGTRMPDPAVAGAAVAALLADEEQWLVRVEGFTALGRMGTAPDSELLRRAMADEHPQVQTAAIRASGRMSGVDDEARTWLATLLGAAEPGVAPDAAEALARLGDLRGLEWAMERSRDPQPLRRADAAPALAHFPAEDRARAALRALLGDENGSVVRSALTAVAGVGQPADFREDIARQLIDGRDPLTRAAAAEALGAFQDQASVLPLLLAADAREAKQKAPDCRLSVLGLLANHPDSADAAEAVVGGLQSRDRLVRQRAAEVLTGWGRGGEIPPGVCQARGKVQPQRYQRAAALHGSSVTAFIDTAHGTITIDLLPREAPLNVLNFLDLALDGYFDGIRFHRVVPGFVVQGGDPEGDGWGGPGYAIRCENNRLQYQRGMVGMALSGKDTGGSQFFFTLAPQPHLDGRYTIFGRVLEGMDLVDRIRRGELIQSVRMAVDPV